MNAKKAYFILIGIVCFLIIAGGLMVYYGTYFMKKRADTLVNAKLDNYQYEAQEQSLAKSKKDLDKYQDLQSLVEKVLPKDKDQARAVSEIYKMAAESNISIEKIAFPSSTLGQKPSGNAQTGSDTTSTSPTSSVTQAKPVDGLTGVLGIDIDVSSGQNMRYDDMIQFLQKIESNRRSMQIKKIVVTPDLTKNVLSFDVTLTIFVKQ